jgi:hypothetical protein
MKFSLAAFFATSLAVSNVQALDVILREQISLILNYADQAENEVVLTEADDAFVEDALVMTFNDAFANDPLGLTAVAAHPIEEEDIAGRRNLRNSRADDLVTPKPPTWQVVIGCRLCPRKRTRRMLQEGNNTEEVALWASDMCEVLTNSNIPAFENVTDCSISVDL